MGPRTDSRDEGGHGTMQGAAELVIRAQQGDTTAFAPRARGLLQDQLAAPVRTPDDWCSRAKELCNAVGCGIRPAC